MDIIIASNNPNKVREFKQLLVGKFDKVLSMAEAGSNIEPIEDGATCKENAIIKAKEISLALNKPVIADDSGIVATALGDEPGVYSARYSGEHDDAANNNKLIKNLVGKDKTAYFLSVVVLYYPNEKYFFGEGRCYGKIIDTPKGDCGFGYDPIFLSDELNKTFGEATSDEKNSVSHRARAIADLMQKL